MTFRDKKFNQEKAFAMKHLLNILVVHFTILIAFGYTSECQFKNGQCLESNPLYVTTANSLYLCFTNCISDPNCNFFTFHSQDNENGYCVLMENCNAISPENCNDCITGIKDSPQHCFPRRGFCQVFLNYNNSKKWLWY